ncbi:MAG: ABC transporter ATP-binding protein [Armatimonadota bacterium]
MLRAENITVGYREKPVIPSLSMTAEPGQITVLVGPNGSGKSTLLRCLARSLRPSSGSVSLSGQDIYRLSAGQAARQIAYVSQDTTAPFAFTVKEMVLLAKGGGGSLSSAEEAMHVLDLDNLADSALTALSGGEQQRAAIARGLAQQTPCLLLDEPTAHLDLRYQSALFRALRRRARDFNGIVVVVVHDLVLAVRNADKIILLNNGVLEASGTVWEVITQDVLERIYKVPIRIVRKDSEIVSVLPDADDLTFS